MATALGGHRSSHSSQRQHSPSASLENSHPQGFGDGRAGGVNPQISTVLGSPFAVKGGKKSESLGREALQEISL